jgi:formylmethanofuran dehydrogenase subunit E
MTVLDKLLDTSAALHCHLCPRQVLGVRMGMLAGQVLDLSLPQADKRLLTIVETDGCFADGVSVATGCWAGRRTLRIEDFGKVAATFIDTHTNRAIRIMPHREARVRVRAFVPEARNKWEAQLLGYQRMPAHKLLSLQAVQLKTPIQQIISRAGVKTVCEICGEDIINEREVIRGGSVWCRSCAGQGYYHLLADCATTPLLARAEAV